MKVLAVDDNETNLEVMRNLCDVMGLECDVARDGAEALERAAAGDYDLILMDICMPIMDGLEATLAIRRLSGAAGLTPVIAVTANAEYADATRYRNAGISAVVSKPVNIVELMGAMQAALDPEVGAAKSAA